MPLSDAVFTLKEDIQLALNDAGASIANGAEDGKTPEQINKKLALDLSNAIHAYTLSAVVVTQVVTVLAGLAAPLAPTGVAGVTGAGMGTGTGNLL
tara:strand:+ start:491 stop:778 length:288 start_codon:yes stop_codon:yes gene_type:complete